jgi:hypothetical protein
MKREEWNKQNEFIEGSNRVCQFCKYAEIDTVIYYYCKKQISESVEDAGNDNIVKAMDSCKSFEEEL